MLQRPAGMHDSQVDSIHTQMPQTKGQTHETSSRTFDGNMMFAASHHTTLFAMMKAMHARCDQENLTPVQSTGFRTWGNLLFEFDRQASNTLLATIWSALHSMTS